MVGRLELPDGVDPVVAAAVAAFGFVFIHPFDDGNDRISNSFCKTRANSPRSNVLPLPRSTTKRSIGLKAPYGEHGKMSIVLKLRKDRFQRTKVIANHNQDQADDIRES